VPLDDAFSRCSWAGSVPEFLPYHDHEWGFPVDGEIRLFEKLCLESFQSGLSWRTILNKRENFRAAFDGFDYRKVAGYDGADVSRLLADAGIIRHRGKIEAVINNAARACELVDHEGSLAAFLWRYEAPPAPHAPPELVATSPESVALAKELRRRGWKFVGPTTVYAFMQAMGLVNDHADDCFVRAQVQQARAAFTPPHG
jgi:DNA-3-methyladenine glycosylase I